MGKQSIAKFTRIRQKSGYIVKGRALEWRKWWAEAGGEGWRISLYGTGP